MLGHLSLGMWPRAFCSGNKNAIDFQTEMILAAGSLAGEKDYLLLAALLTNSLI